MPFPARFLSISLCVLSGPATAQLAVPAPDLSAPMQPLPDLGVAWPEIDAGTPAAPGTSQLANEGPQRYDVSVEGFTDLEGAGSSSTRASVHDQFNGLSALMKNKGDPANAAQIDLRAREDAKLLEDLLRARGYYDAAVTSTVQTVRETAGRVRVRIVAEPGGRYRFSEVAITGVSDEARARVEKALAIKPGDPVDATNVQAEDARFRAALPEQGYAFAEIAPADITVDHSKQTAQLVLAVKEGAAARFGHIRVEGRRLFSARHIELIARFTPGDRYRSSRIDDLRRALIATGLVSTATITPRRVGTTPAGEEIVDLVVQLERAPPRTIAGSVGYGTGEGAKAEISWQHRNFFKPEGAVTFRGIAGTQQQLVSAALRRSNYKRRDQALVASVAFDHQARNAYDARTFQLAAAIERQTNIIWQKKWTYSLGAELLTSDERDIDVGTNTSRRRTFFIAALPASLGYDGSDDLLDPHRGFRLTGRLSPEASLQAGAFGYARSQIDASAYQPLGPSDKFVIAGRVRLGTIFGASRQRIAPSRRFYSGGGGSVRGYGYQEIGPRDANNDPIGGRSLTEFALEARVRFGNFGIVPFLDGGALYTAPLPRFNDLQLGAGLGIRYYSSFGPIRIDVGTPLNRQPRDSRVAVYVSLGQAF